ncbi:hypothetical protein [Ammonifex thiophilus]|uniref:Uncharacterized protein n=1 Tax=Ammonifex thiophilus TaxID=444093 RepID=A0A3D8P373_9THEO|nr:hypothetical protein [Ammonifex thiophilus]RDV81253.1 hypothetical protein DXX99_09435 [Ammonifex thiophilus]
MLVSVDLGYGYTKAVREAARREVGQAIAQAVHGAWSEKADWLDRVLLAGGGAVDFYGEIARLFPGAELVPDPQWANALGFYRLAREVGV